MKSAEAFDRRVFGRRSTTIQASVRIGYRVVPCLIRDLSEVGALLEFEAHIDLPQRLWLSWPGQPNEFVCEVRHARRNTAGVQFTRPQALNLKPAVTPAVVFRSSAATQEEARTGASGKSLVFEHRRAMRQVAAASATQTAEGKQALPSKPPRDLSALKTSLEAAAREIILAKEARRVPMPLAAAAFAGAAVEPARVAVSAPPPRPQVLTRATVPPQQPPAYTPPWHNPALLAAAAYADTTVEAVTTSPPRAQTGCGCHACAFVVWRRIASLAPRPLPARVYGIASGIQVA